MTNNYPKYDPTDIESMLQNKAFDELNTAEKEFALQHVGSPEEYTSMRDFLLNIRSSFQSEEVIEPSVDIKNNLMEEFTRIHSTDKKRSVWSGFLESLFPSGKSIFLSPGFQIATLAVVIFGVGLFIINQNSSSESSLATLTQKESEKNSVSTPESPASPVEESISPAEDAIATGENDEAKPLTDKLASAISSESILNETKSAEMRDDKYAIVLADTTRTYNGGAGVSRQERNKNEGEVAVGSTNTFSSSEVANEYDLDRVELKETAVTKSSNEKSKKSENQQQKRDVSYKDLSSSDLEKAPGKETPGVSAGERSELLDLLFTSL